jgi:hypothetical protein
LTINALSASYELVMYLFQVTGTYETYHDYFVMCAKNAVIERYRRGNYVAQIGGPSLENFDGFVDTDVVSVFGEPRFTTTETILVLYAQFHKFHDGSVFVHRNALHISYRFVLRVTSTVSYILFTTFLKYGYNRRFYSDASSLSQHSFDLLMDFIIISFLIDAVVWLLADYVLTKRTSISLIQRFIAFFDPIRNGGNTQYIMFLIWVTAHITTDVFVAKIPYDTVGFSK